MNSLKDQVFEDVQPVFNTVNETRAYYNKISKVYDILADHSEAPVRKAGIMKLAPQPGEKILEIGFGTGHGLVELAKAVGETGRIYGIDLSGEMLKLSEKLVKKAGLAERVELLCDNAHQLPYKDDMFNGIFMSFTLELFSPENMMNVLQQCKRVLKPTGRIVVVSLSKEGNNKFAINAFEWTHRHFPNLLDCRPIYVSTVLTAAGFIVRDVTMKQMWFPVEIVLAEVI